MNTDHIEDNSSLQLCKLYRRRRHISGNCPNCQTSNIKIQKKTTHFTKKQLYITNSPSIYSIHKIKNKKKEKSMSLTKDVLMLLEELIFQ